MFGLEAQAPALGSHEDNGKKRLKKEVYRNVCVCVCTGGLRKPMGAFLFFRMCVFTMPCGHVGQSMPDANMFWGFLCLFADAGTSMWEILACKNERAET